MTLMMMMPQWWFVRNYGAFWELSRVMNWARLGLRHLRYRGNTFPAQAGSLLETISPRESDIILHPSFFHKLITGRTAEDSDHPNVWKSSWSQHDLLMKSQSGSRALVVALMYCQMQCLDHAARLNRTNPMFSVIIRACLESHVDQGAWECASSP